MLVIDPMLELHYDAVKKVMDTVNKRYPTEYTCRMVPEYNRIDVIVKSKDEVKSIQSFLDWFCSNAVTISVRSLDNIQNRIN